MFFRWVLQVCLSFSYTNWNLSVNKNVTVNLNSARVSPEATFRNYMKHLPRVFQIYPFSFSSSVWPKTDIFCPNLPEYIQNSPFYKFSFCFSKQPSFAKSIWKDGLKINFCLFQAQVFASQDNFLPPICKRIICWVAKILLFLFQAQTKKNPLKL